METRVIGISGSPHRHGNTETLLDAFLEGAESGGAVTRKVVLRELHYSPCLGCNVCHKTGECVVGDDAPGLLGEVMTYDCLAVASPIYSMAITAELKGLIDRAQYIWAKKFVLKTLYFENEHIQQHKGIFISTAGLPYPNVFDTAFPSITALFNILGFEYFDNIVANDMDRYHGIKNHPTALAEAHRKGKHVVEKIRELKIDALSRASADQSP
ncbi:MAG: flavodoxin family protein [Methanoregulaceae archaeon]|nr:flavodoxin family protein [Methanoregulaceae archaeon]